MQRNIDRIVLGWAMASGLLIALVGAGGCAREDDPVAKVAGGSGRWTHVDPAGTYTFSGQVAEEKDLSGIAFVSPTHGLIGADERGFVQVVTMSRAKQTLTVGATFSLLGDDAEVDIEAIAAEDDTYYIVGSHGVAKKTGDYQSTRYTICRWRVDPAAGLPIGDKPEVASLKAILQNDPILGPHFARPLQEKGVNIEGLAIRAGRLFVGLRNPNLDGYAFVIEVRADDVFRHERQPAYTLHKLKLGAGLGIREIVTMQEGFLLIVGNAGSEPSDAYPKAQDYEKDRGYQLVRWDGKGSAVENIGAIPDPSGKAEAMTILDESPEAATLLILFDGPKGGRPSVYRLH